MAETRVFEHGEACHAPCGGGAATRLRFGRYGLAVTANDHATRLWCDVYIYSLYTSFHVYMYSSTHLPEECI